MSSSGHDLALAQKILCHSRRRVSSLCPLLLMPIHALKEEPLPAPGPMFTDGTHLWFWPEQVLEDFRADPDLPAKRLLHLTLHCLLRHLPLRREQLHTPGDGVEAALEAFDLVADARVALFMNGLCGNDFSDSHDAVQSCWLPCQWQHRPLPAALQEVLGIMTDPGDAEELRSLAHKPVFQLDDHRLWELPEAVRLLGLPSHSRLLLRGGGGGAREEDGSSPGPSWKEMLEQMSRQARTSPQWGHMAGILESELRMTESGPISYTRFLRRFVRSQERLLLDPDSFDPRWYHLGLELYGDIPLLEPSEQSEPPSPDELVLVLDTSGSCGGETCRQLLRETASLLRDITSGASSFRILLLQCDTEIQQEFLLESPDQLAALAHVFVPRGFGGTDFTPAFRRVEQLRSAGVLPRVRGLIYLSDGEGDFPDKAPDYPVCFLLPLEQGCWCGTPDLPSWVTAMTLDTENFTLKEVPPHEDSDH